MQTQELICLLCDFIQVWLHQILYQRELYPKGSFELRKQYDVPVAMSTHPEVCHYIERFVTSLQPLLEKQQCHVVSLVIISNKSQQAIERYVFEVDHLPQTALPSSSSTSPHTATTTLLADMQHYFRACLLKLSALVCSLSPPMSDCTFQLGIEMTIEQTSLLEDKHTTWIPSDATQHPTATPWAQLIPIKTMTFNALKVNTYVMESKRKGKHVELV